jgi:translation initiation factor IF-1
MPKIGRLASRMLPVVPLEDFEEIDEGERMAKDDLIRIDGKVCDLSGGGQYVIELDNGMTVNAKLSGRMKKYKIKVLVGDRVTVGLSPYDTSHGLITHRQKL